MGRRFNQLFYDSGSWRKSKTFDRENITPELAADLLRLNGRNRPVSDSYVKRYANDMKEDRWKYAGNRILISSHGLILDGQKRLLAIIESGKPQCFDIVTGLDPNDFDVLDTGQPRTASDTLAVEGIKNYNTIASLIKMSMLYAAGQLGKTQTSSGGRANKMKITNTDVRNFYETAKDKDLISEAAEWGNKTAYKTKWFSPGSYAAFYYLFAQKDRDAAQLFFEMLASGENISKNNYSYVYLLREKLNKLMQSNLKLNQADKYALMIKAWNYMRAGREIKQLSWQPSEEFPIIN
jgi:hypothetical protein